MNSNWKRNLELETFCGSCASLTSKMSCIYWKISLCILVLNVFYGSLVANEDEETVSELPDDIYSITALDIDGDEVALDQFRGKVLLIANVATHCGHAAYNYGGLTRIRDILDSLFQGHFEILAFPCNQFAGQEPGSAEQIKAYVKANFAAEFPLFQKIDVIGSEAHPVFKVISGQTNQTPDWNFWKYLVDHKGKAVKAYGPTVDLQGVFHDCRNAIEDAMKDQGIPVPVSGAQHLKIEL